MLVGETAGGQRWREEELKALIEIWSDENLSNLLMTNHKNDIFLIISKKMEIVPSPTHYWCWARNTSKSCQTEVLED